MSDLTFATRVSRIIRWLLAAGFALAAFVYEDLKILYILAAVLFITGFFKPRCCVHDTCGFDQ